MAGFFAGLVDGVMAGKDWREGKEDRARLRKMQDEEFTWAREDQSWQREDRQFTREERARAKRERDAELAAWNETADELYGPKDGSAPAAPAADTPATPRDPARTSPMDVGTTASGNLGFSINDALTVSTKGQPEAAPAQQEKPAPKRAVTDPTVKPDATLGNVGAGAGGQRAALPLTAPANAGAELAADRMTPLLERNEMTLADAIRSAGEDAVGYRQGQVDPPLAREAGIGRGQPAPGFPPQERPRVVGPVAGRPEVAGSMPAAPEQGPRAMSIMEQVGERGMPQESRDRFNRTQPVAPQAVPLRDPVTVGGNTPAQQRQRAASEAAQPRLPPEDSGLRGKVGGGFTGDYVGPRMSADGPQAPPRAEDASLPAAPTGKPAPKQEAAAAVPETPAGTPMESLAALKMSSEGLSFGIVGKDGPIKTTEARVARVTEQAAKAYERDHVPAIVEHYVRTGQLDKAKAFEQWIEDKGVKEGMKSWLGAIHSFQVGDGEGFLTKLADAYESANYYDDGLTMVREESNLTYDDRGNIVGAQITFKDEATGEVFTQNVSDAKDLVASAIGLMAPEKAFELAYNQTFGVKADTADRMTMGDAVDAINEEANGRMGDQAMTLEEKAAMYEAYRPGDPNNPFRAVGTPSGSLGNVPVYR